MTDDNVVTIEPLGGLGNQLFVYATGRHLANKLNLGLVADLRNYVNYPWHVHELETFENSVSSYFTTDFASGRIKRTLEKVTPRLSIRDRARLFTERTSEFDPLLLESQKALRLRGYFQSWLYFHNDHRQLKSEIRSVVDPSPWYQEKTRELSTQSWVSVHIRRGNYVNISNMGLAGPEYYARALSLLEMSVGRLPVVVFSDDIDSVRTWDSVWNRFETTFIEAPIDSRPIETLNLMALASHSIIANSSFSWWGAWLKPQGEGVTIAPRPWLDDENYSNRSLLPQDWITLGR